MRGGEKSRQKESECLAWLPKTFRCPKCFILIKTNHFFLLVSFLFILLFKCYEVKGDDGHKRKWISVQAICDCGDPLRKSDSHSQSWIHHILSVFSFNGTSFFMIYKNLGTFPYCCHYYLLASSLRESLKFCIFYSLCHSKSTASFFLEYLLHSFEIVEIPI